MCKSARIFRVHSKKLASAPFLASFHVEKSCFLWRDYTTKRPKPGFPVEAIPCAPPRADPDSRSPTRVSLDCYHEALTLAVTGRRPDETFDVHPKPQPGGGHMHGLVRPGFKGAERFGSFHFFLEVC